MTITANLVDRTTTVNPQLLAKCAYLGVAVGATANTPYDVDNPDTVASTVAGYGNLVEGTAAAIRQAKAPQIAVPVNGSVAAVRGSVTQSGTGPAITATGTPRDDFTFKIKMTDDGVLGTSRFRWALDGSTYQGEDYTPSETSGAVTGTVDVTTLTFPTAVSTLTLILDADVGTAVTYTGVVGDTDAATFIASANAAYLAGGSSGRIRLVQGKYIQAYSTTVGTGSTIQVTSASTLDTVFGLSNTTATGAAATFEPPNTGVTFTFPAGTYVLDEVYTCVCTGARFTATDITNAMDGLFADPSKLWDDIVILGVPADGTETKAWFDAISAKLSTWRSTDPKKAVFVFMPSSLGGTGTSAITTNDTDVKALCLTAQDPWICIVHGDGYATGTEFPGKLRRPLVHGIGVLACSRRFSADLGSREFDPIPEFDLVHPDGVTKARDESTAAIKMYSKQSPGQRFTVAKLDDAEVFVVKSVTRSAVTSKFRHVGVMRVGRAALNLALSEAEKLENTDPPVNSKGFLREPFAATKDKSIRNRFESELRDPGHVSEVRIQLKRDEKITETDNVTINGEVLPNGQAESVVFNIGVVSELTLA